MARRKTLKTLLGLVFAIALTGTAIAASQQPLYTLDEAVAQGVVDINYNIYTHRPIGPLVAHLAEINPGLINRAGFKYGGQNVKFLNALGTLAQNIHSVLPRALIGGGFNESASDGYNETLPCGGTMGTQTFTAAQLITDKNLKTKTAFLDISKPRTQEYYTCIGQIFIDNAITYLHFEAPTLVIKASSSQQSAIEGYKRVQDALRSYAASRNTAVYFSGDPLLAKYVKLDGIYMPARFYHTTFAQNYQNKIEQPGVGVGYTYALSPKIVHDTVADTAAGTRVLFYVDNWDESQDDLRRMMELDGQNRRSMFTRSAINAHAGGAYFIPPLEHCEGCVKPEHVGDTCEILPNGVSEYDAYACGDFATIHKALTLQQAR